MKIFHLKTECSLLQHQNLCYTHSKKINTASTVEVIISIVFAWQLMKTLGRNVRYRVPTQHTEATGRIKGRLKLRTL